MNNNGRFITFMKLRERERIYDVSAVHDLSLLLISYCRLIDSRWGLHFNSEERCSEAVFTDLVARHHADSQTSARKWTTLGFQKKQGQCKSLSRSYFSSI